MLSGYAYPIDSVRDEPSYDRFDRRLASFSRLLRFDTRGTGMSDPIDLGSPPSMDQLAQDGLVVLDAAGSSRASVLAGWAIIAPAVVLAVAHPERVSSLVLVNGTARLLRAPDYPSGVPERVLDAVREVTLRPDAVDQGFDALALRAPSVAHDPKFRAWHDRAGNRGASPATAKVFGDIFNHADVRALLPRISVPTLVIHRRDNRWTRVGHGRYLAEHIPDATYVELPGADDLHWVGDSDAVLDEIEEFVTGRRTAPEGDLTLAAVLFTDIVASTEQSARLGHRKWTTLLDRHDQIINATLQKYKGRSVKHTGDGILATFDAATRAVRAASEIRFQTRAIGLDVRAGIHMGEVEVRPDDVLGLTVTIAKRICDLARSGEVLCSETVKSQLVSTEMTVAERGTHVLKGVPEQWQLFAIA
jgi:class 3 adenylate cyclase